MHGTIALPRALRVSETRRGAATINGVLYPVEGDDMVKFDLREAGYARVEVPHADIEAVSWQAVPQEGHIWVYVPVRPGGAPGVGLPEPDAASIQFICIPSSLIAHDATVRRFGRPSAR